MKEAGPLSRKPCDLENLNDKQARKVKKKDEMIRALHSEKLVLLDILAELNDDRPWKIAGKLDNRTYSVSTRMLVYDAPSAS